MKPFFSVIVPVYNVKEYLIRCIESIQTQSNGNMEIILVDDGSTDGSGDLCDELANKYNEIIAFHKPNGGLASARNFGMQHAVGKYICFIDSDDWVEPSMFETLMSEAFGQEIDVIKYGYQKRRNGLILERKVSSIPEGSYEKEEIISFLLPDAVGRKDLFNYSQDFLLSAWSSLYRLDFLKINNITFTSERIVLNEDYLFNVMVINKAESIKVLHEYLYNYDDRLGSLTQRYRINMYDRKKVLYENYKSVLCNWQLSEVLKIRLNHFYIDAIYDCITNECSKFTDHSSKKSIENIYTFLNDLNLIEALKNCDLKSTGLKGRIIALLMKYKSSMAIYYLYRLLKKNK
ncbi:glycosyltransferase family 2 protein [Bacillus sp. OTU2372]|uniref:glycosyltransferase family 2 protein n=1 Tax=Bacillus sp. OTU2372 TaxID=3043858 RepID=UPI00313A7FDB